MALRDWNDDGNNDLMDDFLEYQIYKDVVGDTRLTGTAPAGRSSGGSLFKKMAIAVILLMIVVSVYNALRPKCAYPDCDNSPEEGSSYCALHDSSRRRYVSSYTPRYTTRTTTAPAVTTSPATTARKSDYKSTTKAYDYDYDDDVDRYDNAEDYYDDHYDDFWDEDEAEDYWDQYHDE